MAPVMAPAERSNSPPTISIDTATAMMPSGDEAKSMMFDAPLAVPNGIATAQKNTHSPTTPIRAPISGRMNSSLEDASIRRGVRRPWSASGRMA